VPAACAAIMLAKGLIKEKGVLAPERIEPAPFLDLMAKHGTPWNMVELAADGGSTGGE